MNEYFNCRFYTTHEKKKKKSHPRHIHFLVRSFQVEGPQVNTESIHEHCFLNNFGKILERLSLTALPRSLLPKID